MEKKTIKFHGREAYLLGRDKEGINYYLQRESWDCDWYWGFGYVETYMNNEHPERSRDIESHQHFDSLFFNNRKMCYDLFNEFFVETPFTDKEIWLLLEYMKTAYSLINAAGLFYIGGSHITTGLSKVSDIITRPDLNDEINKKMLPVLFEAIREIVAE